MIRMNLLPPAPLVHPVAPSPLSSFASLAHAARAIPDAAARFAASATQTIAEYRPRLAPLLFAGGAVAALADPSLSMSLLCGGLAAFVVHGINLPTGIVSTGSYRTFRRGSPDHLLAAIEKGDFSALAASFKTVTPNSKAVGEYLTRLFQSDRPRVLRILGVFVESARADPKVLPFVIDLLKSFGQEAGGITIFAPLLSFAATDREALDAVQWLLHVSRDKAERQALIRTHLADLVELTKSAPAEWVYSTKQLKETLFQCAEADPELKPDIARAFGIDPAELMSEATRREQQQRREDAEFRRWVRDEATPASIVERIRQEGRKPGASDGLSEPQASLAAQRIHEILYAVLEEKGKAHGDLVAAAPKSSLIPDGFTIAIADGETMRLLENILEHLIPSADQDLPSLIMAASAMAFVTIHTRTTKKFGRLGERLAIEAEILARADTFDEMWLQMLHGSLESYATGGPEELFFESLRQAPEWVPREG